MILVPALLASALVIDLHGLGLMTPWQGPGDTQARIWVFLPDAEKSNAPAHRPQLRVPRKFVKTADWNTKDALASNEVGVWNLRGYVVSVYREGVADSPQKLLHWTPGMESKPWQALHWLLSLDRVVPDARIVANPFAGGVAVAGVKLSDGLLEAAASRPNLADTIWRVNGVKDYERAFADTVRYRVDGIPAATELRLDPIPGGSNPPKRIHLVVPSSGADVTAAIVHLPVNNVPMKGNSSHAFAVSQLFADEAVRKQVAALRVNKIAGFGTDPICDILPLRVPRPSPCGMPECPVF